MDESGIYLWKLLLNLNKDIMFCFGITFKKTSAQHKVYYFS